MPIARVQNDAPTAVRGIGQQMLTRIRNDSPIIAMRTTDTPTARSRYSGMLAPGVPAHNSAGVGYLIGMLALTYSRVQTVPAIPATFRSDDIPLAHIRNTD